MKSANHIQQFSVQKFLEKMPTIFKWASFLSVLLLPVVAMAAGADTKAMSVEYRDVPGIGSRNLVWIVAQQHLLLAGFVLGVPIFAWVCEIVGWKTKEARYDKLAKEFTKLLTSAYATTALFGGILLFLLIGLYPKLMAYLTDMFFPSFLLYCLLFLLETATLYMYWYGWDYMQGNKKAFHLFLGFLLNLFLVMQPKLTAKALCGGQEVGKISKVIVDPLSHEISHVVVREMGVQGIDRQIPIGQVQQVVSEEEIILRCPPEEFVQFPVLERDQYVTIHDVEIAHLEDHLHVEPGEVLVPLPRLEQGVPRRTFFNNMTHAIGALIALPLVFPVLKYLMKPMYIPFDNSWFSVGNVKKIKKENIGFQFKFTRGFKEAFMPEQQIEKNIWIVKATPEVQKAVYGGKDSTFFDNKGDVLHVNKANSPYIGFSGKCPHLGCGYKWRRTKSNPDGVFLCPCHLSLYDEAGKVIDGPAPRGLDVLPMQVDAAGEIKIIDVEYKAGVKKQIRLL